MIKLYDYQNKGVSEIKTEFSKGKKHLIAQAATGAGKTVIFSYIAQNVVLKSKKVLVLTNRNELLTQTGTSLENFGLLPYYITAGLKKVDKNNSVFVAMSQTLRNRLKLKDWCNWILNDIDLVIIDEAHLQEFNFLFQSGLLDKKSVIGFTATPRRGGNQRQLAMDYDEIIEIASTLDLVKLGYLVNDDYFGIKGVNTEKIKFDSMKGDYSEKDMFQRFDSPKLYAGVVKNWIVNAFNTHTIVFCVNIQHIIKTVEEFQKNGIDARFLCSGKSKPKPPIDDTNEAQMVAYSEKLSQYIEYLDAFKKWSGDRNEIVKDFKDKKFTVLVNAGILTTGFDCPSIETVIINRATTSLTLWLQMLGRGSRIFEGKSHFNILDFGSNAERLGHYITPQYWSLWHEKGNSGEGIPPVKDCGGRPDKNGREGCERLIMASLNICPFCGYLYSKTGAKEVELISMAYDTEENKAILTKRPIQMTAEELYVYFKLKGHKIAWLWRNLYYKGGLVMLKEFGESHKWTRATIFKATNYCIKNIINMTKFKAKDKDGVMCNLQITKTGYNEDSRGEKSYYVIVKNITKNTFSKEIPYEKIEKYLK
jgi:superfamily II DNA or RNA helicase